MDRRRFITGVAKAGFGAIALGGVGKAFAGIAGLQVVEAQQRVIDLTIGEALVEMADKKQVYIWTFKDSRLPLSYPGPAIIGREGELVSLKVTNTLKQPHEFKIQGTTITTGTIAAGKSVTIQFPMPQAGTYLYLDSLQAPINRVMGLHGAIVSLPVSGTTPYSNPTAVMQELFNDLGGPLFPGNAWDPNRWWIWLFGGIDPVLHAAIQAGKTYTPAQFLAAAKPRYFTINGKGGYFSAHDPQIAPSGMVGQPGLIRILNAGLASHSPHIHGNHVYMLRATSAAGIEMPDNLRWVDTSRAAQATTLDWLLPFQLPPDIPERAGCWPPYQELNTNLLVPANPMVYPMHCHCEMSQSANGGNYPAGLITHWNITGDARPGGVGSFLPAQVAALAPKVESGAPLGINTLRPNRGTHDGALTHSRR